MLQDKSEDFHETWQFLDRRFEDVGVVGNTISTANDLVHGMSFSVLYTSLYCLLLV